MRTSPAPAPRYSWLVPAAGLVLAGGDVIGRPTLGDQTVSALWTGALSAILIIQTPLHVFSQARAGGPRAKRTDSRREPLLLNSRNRMPRAFLIFLCWAVAVSLGQGSLTVSGLQNLLSYWIFTGAALLVAVTSSAGTARIVQRMFFWAGLIRAVVFGAGWVLQIPVYSSRAFALTALVVMAVLIPARDIGGWIGRILPYILFVEIVASGSRIASAAAAIMLAFLVLRNRRGGYAVRALILFSGCGLLLWELIHRVAFLNERFFGGDQARVGRISLNTEGRSVLWSGLWTVAQDNLWIGQGAGTATDIARAKFVGAGEPHNDYLRFIVDYGVIGCAIWLVAILALLHRLWRRGRARSGDDAAIHYSAFLAVLGMSVVAITDNVLIYHYVLLPVAVLVGSSLAHSMKADPVEREQSSIDHVPGYQARARGQRVVQNVRTRS